MLLLVYYLFSNSLVQANNVIVSSQNGVKDFASTTPQTRSFIGTPRRILNPHNLDPHYDWSISEDEYLGSHLYNYKDIWWVTIRDFYRLFSSPTKMTLPGPEYTTESYVDDVRTKRNETHFDKSEVRINFSDLTRSGKRDKVNNALKHFKFHPNLVNLKGTNNDGIDNSVAGIEARDNAIKRNKQIQRMLNEINPKANETFGNRIKEDINSKPSGNGHNMNILYNKIVENIQVNVSEKDYAKVFDKINDLKQYYNMLSEYTTTTGLTTDLYTAVHRQGTPSETTLPETTSIEIITSRRPRPGDPPWIHEIPWATTQRPTGLVQYLKRKMAALHLGYFSVFVGQAGFIIAGKPDKVVRVLGLSLEREFMALQEEKYILTFGEQFLDALHQFVTHFPLFPLDYVKHQAMLLHHSIDSRREYFANELNSILDFIDSLYEDDEGLALFKSLEVLNNYPNTTENSLEVLRIITKAVFAPYKRLGGSIKREVLVESINEYLDKFKGPIRYGTDREYNLTRKIRRRFSNRTRFAVVGRDNVSKIKDGVKNATKLNTPKSLIGCIGNYCPNNQKAYGYYDGDLKPKINNKDNQFPSITQFYKVTSVTHRSTLKYKTPRMKQNIDDFKQKHPKIYKKYIQNKRKTHKKHKKKKRIQEQNEYFGSLKKFGNINGYENYSKTKAEKLRSKLFLNLSETDYEDADLSGETDYYSDSDEDKIINPKDGFKSDDKERKLTALVNSPKTTIKIQTKTTRSSIKLKPAQEVISYDEIQSSQANEINIAKGYTGNLLEENNLKNIFRDKYINYNTNQPSTSLASDESVSKFNKNNISSAKPTNKTNKFDTANKIIDSTSYSDEEDTLKFQISDAIRHNKMYLTPVRRSNVIENRFKQDINKYSSYSSEEVVLRSNIYKTLGFHKFGQPNDAVQRANDDVDKTRNKKLRFPRMKPINEVSSYSDEESVLKEKLRSMKWFPR